MLRVNKQGKSRRLTTPQTPEFNRDSFITFLNPLFLWFFLFNDLLQKCCTIRHSTRIESARSLVKCKLYHQALTCYEALILSIPAANITIVRQRTMLLVSAWQVLCQYSHIRHCTARKIALRLRYGDEEKHVASPELIRKAVELQTEWAEESVSCQRQLYKVKQWEKRCGGKPPSARRRLLPKATTTPKKNQVVAPQA